MTERIIPKNEKEIRKKEAAEAKSLLIKAGLSQEKQIIEKEVIKEIPIEKIIEKEIEVIKEVDNPKVLERVAQLEASIKEDSKVIADLKAKLEESKKAIAKFENLKKLLDSAN